MGVLLETEQEMAVAMVQMQKRPMNETLLVPTKQERV